MPATAAFLPTPRRWRRLIGAVAVALPLAAPMPAAAQSGLDAAALQQRVQAALQDYVRQSEGALQPQGEPAAVQDGDSVLLTLPPMLVQVPEGELQVPSATVRLRQQDADRIAFSTALPMPLRGVEPGSPEPIFTVEADSQRIEGIYRPSLLTFERFDLRLDGLRAAGPDGRATIGALRLDAGLEEVEGGFWNGRAVLSIGEVQFYDPQQQPQASLGAIEMRWVLDHYRQAEFSELQRRIVGDNPFAFAEPDPEAQLEPMLEMLRRLPELLAGAAGEVAFTLRDLEVDTPAAPPFAIERIGFSLSLAPHEPGHYGLALALGAAAPEIADGMLPVPARLLPSRADIAAELKRLPVAALWQTFAEPLGLAVAEELQASGEISPETEQQIEEQMELFPLIAMELLGQAGSYGEIQQIEIAVGPATLTARGVAPLLPGQPEPALRIEAAIAGLDDLAGEIQALEPAQQEELMPFVVMLRGMGRTTVQDGKVVHTYLVEQAPDGRITVNGVGLDEIAPN